MRDAKKSIATACMLMWFVWQVPRASAQDGIPLWTNIMPASSPSISLVVDSSSRIFVATESSLTNIGPYSAIDYAIASYSNDGPALWTNVANGYRIAPDGSGNLFVAGAAWNGSNLDYAVTKYANTGVPIWTN